MFLLEVGHFGHLSQVVRWEGKCTGKKLTGQIGLVGGLGCGSVAGLGGGNCGLGGAVRIGHPDNCTDVWRGWLT